VLDALDNPRTDFFYRHYYDANRPAKLTGIVDHWPALTCWATPIAVAMVVR